MFFHHFHTAIDFFAYIILLFDEKNNRIFVIMLVYVSIKKRKKNNNISFQQRRNIEQKKNYFWLNSITILYSTVYKFRYRIPAGTRGKIFIFLVFFFYFSYSVGCVWQLEKYIAGMQSKKKKKFEK